MNYLEKPIPSVVPLDVERPDRWLNDRSCLNLSNLYNQPYASDITLTHTSSGRTWHLHSDVILAILQTEFDESTLSALASLSVDDQYLDCFFQYLYGKWDGISNAETDIKQDVLMRILHVLYIANVCGADNVDELYRYSFISPLLDAFTIALFKVPTEPTVVTRLLRRVSDFMDVMSAVPEWANTVMSLMVESLATSRALEHEGVLQSLKLDGKLPNFIFRVRTETRRANVTISVTGTDNQSPPQVIFNIEEKTVKAQSPGYEWDVFTRKYWKRLPMHLRAYSHQWGARMGLHVYGRLALKCSNPHGRFNEQLEAAATQATVQTKYAHLLPRPNFIVATAMSKTHFWVHDWLLYAKWSFFVNLTKVSDCEEMKTRKLVLNDVPENVLRYFLQRLYESCEYNQAMEVELQSWSEYGFVANKNTALDKWRIGAP